MNILALETSTEACSVALMVGNGEIYSSFEIAPRQHTYHLPRMMDAMLRQAGMEKTSINAVAYANGPGAFTGVRIATATAQGLAIGLGVSLIPVSTLAVVAQQAGDELNLESMRVALDARMGEAYTAAYRKIPTSGLVELVDEEVLVKLEELEQSGTSCLIGSGFRARREAGFPVESTSCVYEDVYPTAAALARLALQAFKEQRSVSAGRATINYIRNRVAHKKTPR